MAFPALYAVVDAEACTRAGRTPEQVTAAFVAAGVRLVQIRAKDMGAAAVLALARDAVRRDPAVRVIVNDRPDLAVLADAGGVHVGQDDLSVTDARAIVGPHRWVGVSTHTTEQAAQALDERPDYLAIGPVFETGTKRTGYEPVGLDTVRAVAALARARGVPVVAIGGITLDRTATVLAAGAASVCVIGDLLRGEPEARARAFLAATSALQSRPGG